MALAQGTDRLGERGQQADDALRALVELMDRRFNAGITPIRDAELVPLVRAGTRLQAATKACARP